MKAIVYNAPYDVRVEKVEYPKLELHTKLQQRKCEHGVIIKLIATNICGSDEHMVRGRTNVESGTQLGHEMTGEVIEIGRDVEFVKIGDLVSVPFNVACGRCVNCGMGSTNSCLHVNPEQPGGSYGYAMMGDWKGGQSEYAMIPYADFNLLVIPDKNKSMKYILDLAMLSDILPTGYDAALRGGVSPGKSVFIAGCGPVGICCAASCIQLLGASKVIVADFNQARLDNVSKMGCITLNLSQVKTDKELVQTLYTLTGLKEVDVGIDCVGFESNGHHGNCRSTTSERSEVLNMLFKLTKASGSLGIPGVYIPMDLGAEDAFGKKGGLALDYGVAWNKGLSIAQGQCPVKKYNYHLMQCILNNKLKVAEYLNIKIISLEEAPKAYKEFSDGTPMKYVIDPHNMLSSL